LNGPTNPDWWRSYNRVKHQRHSHFHEANLQNTINAVGALLIATVYYYKYAFSAEAESDVNIRETTRQLQPTASFIHLDPNYYYKTLIT
jgi:hypothetical protein